MIEVYLNKILVRIPSPV